jgi:hypothetical protein
MAEEKLGIEERLSALEEKVAKHSHPPAAPAVEAIANPAPLGLFAFGLTTLMLNLVNADLVVVGTKGLVIGYGMFFGGLCQILAGMWEFKKNNTFGATAFTSYGAFWMGYSLWYILVKTSTFPSPDGSGLAAILAVWGMFTFLMFIGTLKLNRALQAVFLTLTVLFFLLAAGDMTENKTITTIAGYEGILCAFTAIYAGWAQVINEVWGRTVLPLWPVKK